MKKPTAIHKAANKTLKKLLSTEQEERAEFIEKNFQGLTPISNISWEKLKKGDVVRAVQGSGIITNPSYYIVFGGKVLEGKITKKTTEICKYGKKDVEVHNFSILWNYDKVMKKEVNIRTSNIVHDPYGLVANQIFVVE